MSHPGMYSVAAQASRSIDLASDSNTTDSSLLTRFIQNRDEAAFAELVRRLGPMVLGICRRSIGDNHLAEDAFQAVFLVLARRASDVRPREGLRGWLHGVAVRTARRARTVAIRHRIHEVAVSSVPDRMAEAVEPPDTDAIRVLDEEVGALPDHLRVVVVLCELEGMSRTVVAERLKIPEGTLSSRLAKARKRLANRMRQRGIALSIAAVTTALTRTASASPQTALVARAALAATREPIPASVVELSNGVLRMMFLEKLKTTIPLGMMVIVLLACATVAAMPSTPPPIPPRAVTTNPILFAAAHTDSPQPKIDPKPLLKGPNKLLVFRNDYLFMIDPDGKNEIKVSENKDKFFPGTARLSPDGKKLAVLIQTNVDDGAPKRVDGAPERVGAERKLYVRELSEEEPGTYMGISCQWFVWSPDGTQIITTELVLDPKRKIIPDYHLVNVKTKEKKPLKLPDNHLVFDWTSDGKYFATVSFPPADDSTKRLHLLNLDGTEHKVLIASKEYPQFGAISQNGGRLSPDGTQFLYLTVEFPKDEQEQLHFDLAVLNISTKKITKVPGLPANGSIYSFCWSPDGKKIALTWRQRHEGKLEDAINKKTESRLIICDPDGKNQTTIASETGSGQQVVTIGEIDWR